MIKYLLLLFVLLSCHQNNDVNKWGLEYVEFQNVFTLTDSTQISKFNLSPKRNSKRIEINLYFESLSYTNNDINIGKTPDLRDSILMSLEGLELSIIEKNTGSVILDYEINYWDDLGKKDLRKYSFATNRTLSLFIETDIEFKKSFDVEMELTIPALIQESSIKDFTFVIGESRKIYL